MIAGSPRRLLLALPVLVCAACGYVGPPLPPALNLPNRVTDLTALQRGPKLLIHFTMSRMTTEAMPIASAPEIDLRIGASGPRFNLEEWLPHARRLSSANGRTDFEAPVADYVGKDVVIAVRLLNDRGKTAGWSNFVPLLVTAPLPRPEGLAATATAQGVRLAWSGGGAPLYRIYRKGRADDFAPLGDTPQSPYLDATAEFGKPYTYFVQGIQKNGEAANLSEASDRVEITPADTFPPAVPANLKAIVGAKSVELSWDRDTEPDLAGYRVFRAAADGPFTLAADKLPSPSYSDRAAPRSRYRYAVSAFDLAGNESPRTAVVEVDVP